MGGVLDEAISADAPAFCEEVLAAVALVAQAPERALVLSDAVVGLAPPCTAYAAPPGRVQAIRTGQGLGNVQHDKAFRPEVTCATSGTCQQWHAAEDVSIVARAERGTLRGMSTHDLTAAEREALNELLPPTRQTGNLETDLAEAARTAMRRRIDNSRWGGAVIGALHRQIGSWRQLEDLTGIPHATARRWAAPPPGTESN